MEFIGIIGDRGSGKTNLLTAILYQAHLKGRKVVANFHLRFPHVYMPFSEIRKMPGEIEGAELGLDELGRGADSYEFFTKDSKEITNLILQIRKMGARCNYTVQRFRLINKRLRDQTDGFILCDDIDGKRRWYYDESGDIVEVEDHREICNGRFEVQFYDANRKHKRTKIFNGKPFWNLYDTREIIAA